jgi:F-type H+-transporting ATPase subunit delta
MKITAQQYAKTLNELTRGKSHGEINDIVAEFIKLIASKNQSRLIPQVIEKFKEIWNKENGVVEAEVISREELSIELRNKLRNYISNKYKAKEVLINHIVNESVKGGIIMRVGDEVLDGSVAGKIKMLNNCLKK